VKVPFIDLMGQVEDCGDELDKAVVDVARSCGYILGKQGLALEESIAKESGTNHAVGVASGTDALILALWALGLKPGEEVVVPAFTFAASVSAIIHAGGKPRFVDIDERTFNMDIEQAISVGKDAAGFLPVHLYGLPLDISNIVDHASGNGQFVLEDCAQAFGAKVNGKAVCSFGNAGILSFYPTKNLSAIGDAGMILTNDEKVAEQARLLRNHGESVRYHHSVLGRNSRLDEIQAAALNVKLPHVRQWNETRRKAAALYDEGLKGIGDIVTPFVPDGAHHVYNLYTVRTSKRDELREFLGKRDIGSGIYYPLGMHLQPVFKAYVSEGESFPVTEKVSNEVLSIPMYSHIDKNQVEYVIEKIRDFYS
jgi:dTDP-4-amino-4,6-dideoxygalactose transaminase